MTRTKRLLGLVAMMGALGIAQAQTEVVLHNFAKPEGEAPGGLIRDSAGNLYGTTEQGGAAGYGVVFRVNRAGKEAVLYSFTGGDDGGTPNAGVMRDSAGNLYGTTSDGGAAGLK